MTLRSIFGIAAYLTTAALLAACAGGNQSTPATGSPNAFSPLGGITTQPLDQGCSNSNGIKVIPCRIRFDSGHPGPIDVTVTQGGPSDGGGRQRIIESDDCASRQIASLAKDSKNVYTVTAGSSRGFCTARFSDSNRGRGHGGPNDQGGGNRGSDLSIINNV